MSVHRIVLTGGPCGGKSSMLKELQAALAKEGIAVYFAPEVATVLFGAGCVFPGLDGSEQLVAFEVALSRLQQQMEASFTKIALATGKPSVVLFDRGLLDNAAYLPKEGWEAVLAALGLTEASMLARYDSVLHLVTAADGAEKFYKWGRVKDDSGNDVYRKESPEDARDLDRKIASAWAAHPNVGRMDNASAFPEKIKNAVSFVLKRVTDMPCGTILPEDFERLRTQAYGANVHRNVLTGGPCGGKSSALEELKKALTQQGVSAYCAPEVATILFGGGCTFPGFDGKEQLIAFEAALTQLQQQMEASFGMIARSTGRPSVIFFDRGILDNAAYLPKEGWDAVLAATELTEEEIRGRYDSVLHLVTAADGAEKFYKWGNVKDDAGNDVYRKESPEEARELDRKIAAAWAAHPNVGRMENTGDFKLKLTQITSFILSQLEGMPSLRLLRCFKALDEGDGAMSADKLCQVLARLDPQCWTNANTSAILNHLGVERGGQIRCDDWISWVMAASG